MMIKWILSATILSPFLLTESASAQVVQKINNQSILLQGVPSTMKVGDEFITINEQGKRTAIIQVIAVKDARAVAKILKGTAFIGETLTPRQKPIPPPDVASAPAPVQTPPPNPEPTPEQQQADMENIRPLDSQKTGHDYWGFLLGASMDTLLFLAADNNSPALHTENASLTGSSIKLKGFWDHPLNDSYTFRFMTGYDGFNGTYRAQSPVINKDGSSTSNLSTSFLTAEGEIMWNFYKKSLTTMWVGGGYAFEYVMSMTSNMYSLQLSSPYLSSFFVGVGSNIEISKNSYVPIFLHYNYYLTGSGVSQTSLNVGAGYGWAF